MFGRTRTTILVSRRDLEQNRETFLRLLDQCGLLAKIENDEQRHIHNWGINLLENAGLQGENRIRCLDAIIGAVLTGDIPEEDTRSGRR